MAAKFQHSAQSFSIMVDAPVRIQSLVANQPTINLQDYVAARVDGVVVDLSTKLEPRSNAYRIELIASVSETGTEIIRHSAAHLLARAVQALWGEQSPNGKRIPQGNGPPTDTGFYQDFDLNDVDVIVTADVCEQIAQKMREIVRTEDALYERSEVTKAEARLLFANDPYKLEFIDNIDDDDVVSIYSYGAYKDLCRGPHVPGDRWLRALKLTSVSSAHWQGDQNDTPRLTRIRGMAEASEARLEELSHQLAEAARRDHRRLGPEMGLFVFAKESPGSVLYAAKGMVVRRALEDFKRETLERNGFDEVLTPTMWTTELWEQSGHMDNYKENMFFVAAGDEHRTDCTLGLKPMNCPGHAKLFASSHHSYRDLPVRLAEFGVVHRNEKSGALKGMLRARTFTQDDAHLFVTEDQLHEELTRLIRMYQALYEPFGFGDLRIVVSTRPEKRVGASELWDKAEGALIAALEETGNAFEVDDGEGAFYGPKIDFSFQDAIGRYWQTGTIQVDFNLPERFDLTYTGPDGEPKRPVMIHPATYGSFERFLAILVEHFEGKLPLWLAPTQVVVLPVSVKALDYAEGVTASLKQSGIRAKLDSSDHKLNRKIANAYLDRAPYMLILGANEAMHGTVSVRDSDGKSAGAISLDDFVEQLRQDISCRRLSARTANEFRSEESSSHE